MDIGLEITTSRNATLRFEEFPVQARDKLKNVIADATNRLQAMARADAPKRTGRLASEIVAHVNEYQTAIVGVVSIAGKSSNDFAKAAALEYGAHGSAQVKAHQAKLDHYFSKPMDTIDVAVSGHTRKLNIKQHDYLRGSESRIAAEALSDMRAAIDEVTRS